MEPTSPPETIIKQPRRPAYLGWLAGYLVVIGGVLCAMQLIAYSNLMKSGAAFDYPPALLLASIIFPGVIGITAGSGLWWGKKWGWWLSAFYFLYALARQLNTLLDPASTGLESTRSWLGAGLGVVLSLLVLLYLYSHELLAHFHLEKFPRWVSLVILLVVAAILAVLL